MKKCSTAIPMKLASQAARRALLCVCVCVCVCLCMLLTPPYAQAAATRCEWASDAPAQHQVQRGDTLWAIASVFLQNPWCWPQVWEGNREAVRDPHRIYPGQLILLDKTRGVLRAGKPGDESPVTRWSPSVRAHSSEQAHIPVISGQLLRMLSLIRVLDQQRLEHAPVITGMTEGRKFAAEGDSIFVRGDPGSELRFDVIRPFLPVVDPDSKQPLGIIGRKLGSATLAARGTLTHRLLVSAAGAELQVGDRLLPATQTASSPISIHPSEATAGKLAAILHEGRWAGTNDLVVVNRGAEHGLTAGSVASVARQVRIRADESTQTHQGPEEAQPIALLLVLSVAERMSVAVVMRPRDTVTVGDIVLPP